MVIAVGLFAGQRVNLLERYDYPSYQVDFTRPGLALAYGAINGSSIRTADGRQYVKNDSGAWTDGDRTVTRFEEPEGTFAVAENAPTRY